MRDLFQIDRDAQRVRELYAQIETVSLRLDLTPDERTQLLVDSAYELHRIIPTFIPDVLELAETYRSLRDNALGTCLLIRQMLHNPFGPSPHERTLWAVVYQELHRAATRETGDLS